jgi:ubiquilin
MGGLNLDQQPDPEQLMQILDNPMMSQMMQQMVDSNPDMIRGMIEQQNPMFRQMFGGDTERANQFVRQMMNPQALRQMVQLQQTMGGVAGGPGMFGMPPPTGSAGSTPGAGGLDFSNILAGAGTSASGAPAPFDFGSFLQQVQPNRGGTSPSMASPWGALQPPMDYGSMLQQMQGGVGAPGGMSATQHPADRFRTQLSSLRDMGFDDEQACLAALQQNHGNLNRAVDQLLMGTTVATDAPAPSTAAAQQEEAPASSTEEDNSTPKPSEDKKKD